MKVGFVVQMASLVEMRCLVQQVPLVQERIPAQGAHPAVTQYGLSGRLADTIYTQADGRSCHDRCLYTTKHLTLLLRSLGCLSDYCVLVKIQFLLSDTEEKNT